MLFLALRVLLNIIEIVIFIRVIISWIPIPRDNPLVVLLYQVTEPILAPIRGMIEKSALGRNAMFDFSPLIALILVQLIRSFLPY